MREGKGVLKAADGSLHYEGEFVCNLYHGEGTLTSPDGSRYAGDELREL